MAISKSTPYVRYKESFTSNLHLGTIHVESEYLDRTQKTTIESIYGMTWHNKVVNENKELDLLSNLGFELTESKKEYFNVEEQRVSVDEIHGMQDIEPNEDGTYTYSVTSIEGEYAEIYDGLNHITSTSDGLDGNFEIVYDTDEEDITGSVVLDATMPNYTIEDSNIGELNSVVFKGETLINILPQPSLRNKMENTSMQRLNEGHDEVVVADGEYKSVILKGQTLVNIAQQYSKFGTYTDDVNFDGEFFSYTKPTTATSGLTFKSIYGNFEIGKQISIYVNNQSDTSLYLYDSSYRIKGTFEKGISSVLFTTDSDSIRIGLLDNSIEANIKVSVMMFEGDCTNCEIPYFTGIQSVKMPVLTTTGKNLFDVSRHGSLTPQPNGDIQFNNSWWGKYDVEYNLKPNTQYTITLLGDGVSSCWVAIRIDGNTQSGNAKKSFNRTFSTNSSGKVMIGLYANTDGNIGQFVKSISMEEGTVSTPYEPHKSNILTCNEEVELRGIGDIKDELNLLTGKLTQRVGEIVLDENNVEFGQRDYWETSKGYIQRFQIWIPALATSDWKPIRLEGSPFITSNLPSDYGGDIENKTYIRNVNYNTFNIYIPTIMSMDEFKVWFRNNPITMQYQLAQVSIKTIDLSVTDQDNVVLETGKPRSYKDGYIQVQSNGILPSSISYEVPSQNHMYVDMLKPSNTYTLKRNGKNFEGSFFIDGTEYNTNVFMTSHQLPNKSLIINDMSEHDKVAMFEGNYGTSTIPYFEGMTSVKMPILTTVGKNLFDINKFKSIGIDEQGYYIPLKFVDNADAKATLKLKPNTKYVVTGTYIYTGKARFTFRINDGAYRNMNDAFETDATGVVNIKIGSNTVDVSSPSKIEKIMIVESTLKDIYEPYKSNILTCNEEVTLRAIGEVKDEYNVETGELTQRIGEVVLDGSENWRIQDTTTTNTVRYYVDNVVKNAKPISEDGGVCDKIPYGKIYDLDEIGVVLTAASGHCYIRSTIRDLSEFKTWLQSNPITVQYQLTEPTTRKIISTILDQDGKQTHSMHTYTGLTNLSTSSDTLIPNVGLDYEISSSTGTVTGTSATIENGENGSPISAIVYGESLINNIQEPSDVEYVALGEYSGNNITIENSVEGNIENAVIKGMTLVNLGGAYNRTDAPTWYAVFATQQEVEQNKRYYAIINNIGDGLMRLRYKTSDNVIKAVNPKSCEKFIFTATESDYLRIKNSDTISNCNGTFLLLEYQEGMENWDIPYFEGMGSVKQPVLTTTGKNLFQSLEWESGSISSKTGADSNHNQYIRTKNYIDIQPNATYTATGYMEYFMFYDGDKNFISSTQGSTSKKSITFTTPSNAKYLRLRYFLSSIPTLEAMLNTENMLELGEQSTGEYEPHKSNTLTINEPIELRGVGDIKDELDLVTGKLTQRIGNITLDGSTDEEWSLFRKDTKTNVFEIPILLNIKLRSDLLSNLFDGKYVETIQDGVEIIKFNNSKIYVNISNTKATTVEDFKNYIAQQPLTIQYQLTTQSVKTIDLTVTDQDSNPTSLHSYNGTTHITTNSQGLTANVEISNPSYDVALKANTKYTLKLNRTNAPTNTPLEINLGGTEATMDSTVNSIAITTPSALANNKLTMSGVGNKFKEAMVIEGDYVDRDLDYFEGIVGVENPILATTCKNLFNPKNTFKIGYMNWQTGHVTYSDGSYDSVTDFIPIQEIEPGTYYFHYKDETNRIDICFYDGNKNFVHGAVTKAVIPNTAKYMIVMVRNIKQTIIPLQMEKGTSKTEYEPYQGNILATYPQVTLHSIGDIKDELDLVNETVTRRVGEVVLNGSEDWRVESGGSSTHTRFSMRRGNNIAPISNITFEQYKCNKFRAVTAISGTVSEEVMLMENYDNYFISLVVKNTRLSTPDAEGLKTWLSQNPTTVIYLIAPTTESVRITPPNPQTSIASVTLSTQLGESDYVTWNPYKEHYVYYNYEQDGSYTWDNLTDLNERQFIELYDRRTYVEQEYKNTFLSHDSKGTSKYVLIEPNQDYTVTVRFSELPQCETVKVNLGGSEVEMNVSDPHVHVTTPTTLSNYLCSILGKGLSGKITDILVIHCLEHEGFADIDYFEGIDSIGEVVDGKASIIVEQTNGNLIDKDFEVHQNGNAIRLVEYIDVRPNKKYIFKAIKNMSIEQMDKSLNRTFTGVYGNGAELHTDINTAKIFISASNTYSNGNGSTHRYHPIELCLKGMEKDYIRPRYNSSQEIILPIQLCRINTVYDNFYYDVIRGHYRIQQSIGHKYFTGADNENWTLIENGERILRFRYNNADIQIKSLGEYMTNRFTNGTATSPYESCAFNGSTFIISIDKERLSSATLVAFKEWLSSHNVHLYYQLASPMMIDLPQYSSKLELNTYKDEIYTFLKNCKPTVFTLNVPLDQTYRFYELQESQGYTNRIELTDERMTEEDALYINTIYGSGISNLIEEPNNVNTLLKPNYEGRATSHTLTNGKVSTIGVHGFEPNSTRVGIYNTVTKQYELTVKTTSGENNSSVAFPIPYALEQYEDGTHDIIYYNSEHKQWMFEGGQTLTVAYNSDTGAFTNAIEIFRGMTPRSGMIGEFKVKFASGTTSARLYYSLDGSTYTYTTLRSMTDGVEYYIAFFNTGGTKIDMGTKIGADSEYTTLVPLSGTITEALMINQIQSITECTYYLDKTYYYTEPTRPIELTVYDGTNTITENNGAIITIENNAHNKDALIYANTPYTVYWTRVGGQGNIRVTLGGVTQEVAATQGYVTITTSDTDLEKGLLIGGFDVTIKDLMLVKGERIADLSYFEGSRAVGTAFIDEDGNTMYRVTLVTGSELIQDKFEDVITFEDNKKHNVLVTKLLGTKPNKN